MTFCDSLLSSATQRGARALFAGLALLACLGARAEEKAENELPLDLEKAVQLALEKNYTIRIESISVPIARAGVTEALGAFDLTLTGSYADGREEDPALKNPLTGLRAPKTVTDTDVYSLYVGGYTPWGMTYKFGGSTTNERGTENAFSDAYTTTAGLSLTQPLLKGFGFGASLYTVRIARIGLASSEWEYRNAMINVITSVSYAYHDVLYTRAVLRSAQRSLELAQQLQTENERRFALGERSEFDILSAKARVASRRQSVISAERYVRSAEYELLQLISDNRKTELLSQRLRPEPYVPKNDLRIDPAADFRTALVQRPDYQLAVLSVKKGKADKSYNFNQLLPAVNLVGSWGYNGLGSDFRSSREDVKNKDYPVYSTGVNVSVPLTSATERGRYRSSRLKLQQAELLLEKLEQDIVVAVGNAADQLRAALRRVESTREARELNDKLLEAEIKRLRAGTGSTFNVLYQQEQLNSAEISEAQALADCGKATAEYERQLGRTLDDYHIVLDRNAKR